MQSPCPPSNVAGEELYGLKSPLECLLTSGGDPRLRLDPVQLLNGYGCQPWPRPEGFTFASSTATSISERGFAAAARAQQHLIESSRQESLEDVCDSQTEWLREQLKTFLGLGSSDTQVIFSPSGTDSQVHALYVAQTVLDGPLVSVIVGSDETGSGTARAMIGCHFSSDTAQGGGVIEGGRIAGFAEDTVRLEIPLREECGRLRSASGVWPRTPSRRTQAAASLPIHPGRLRRRHCRCWRSWLPEILARIRPLALRLPDAVCYFAARGFQRFRKSLTSFVPICAADSNPHGMVRSKMIRRSCKVFLTLPSRALLSA